MAKGKTLSRARATPRQIRDIRPARQLPRSEQSQQDENDDWWFRSGGGGGGRASGESSSAAAHIHRVATVNGARVRFGRSEMMGADEAAGSDSRGHHGHDRDHQNYKGIKGKLVFLFKRIIMDMIFVGFMALPMQKKLKRVIAGLIIFSAWKSIYFADLDNYSKPKWESTFLSSKGASSPGVTVKAMDKELSSLAKDSFDSGSIGNSSGGLSLGQKLMQAEMALDRGASPKTSSLYSWGNNYDSSGKSMLAGQAGSQNYQGANMGNMMGANGQSNSMSNTWGGGKKNSVSSGGNGVLEDDDWINGVGISSSKSLGSSGGQSGVLQSKGSMSQVLSQQQNHQPQYLSPHHQQTDLQNSNSMQSGMSQSNSWSNPQQQQGRQNQNHQPQYSSFQNNISNNTPNDVGLQSGISQSQLWSAPQQQRQHQNLQPQLPSFQQQPGAVFNGNSMQSSMSQPKMMSWSNTQSQQQQYQQPQYSSFQQQSAMSNSDNSMQSNVSQPKMTSWSNPQQNQHPQYPSDQIYSEGNTMQSNSAGAFQSKQMLMTDLQSQHQNDFNSFHSPRQTNGNAAQEQPQVQSNSQQQQQHVQGLRGSDTSSYSNQLQNKFDAWAAQNGKSQGYDEDTLNEGGELQQKSQALNCDRYGGPYTEEEVSELIYWRNIPSDALFVSPYYMKNNEQLDSPQMPYHKTKYLTFEMDGSGWNNVRMGFENLLLLSHAMGRILVLPPKRQIFHMADKSAGRVFSLDDFYDIEAINANQQGLHMITMEEFLKCEGLNGNLRTASGQPIFPPNNQTKWDNERLDALWEYMRVATKTFRIWEPMQCVMAFPAKDSNITTMASLMNDILIRKDGRPFPRPIDFQGAPTPVDAPPIERLREILSGRRKVCMYDESMHRDYDVVHFRADEDSTRLITDFYTFLFFEDFHQDLWSKRFIRDYLRYKDEIFCLAARVVNAIRNHAKERMPSNEQGHYDAIHIRRKDFQTQFPTTRMTANDILIELKKHVVENSTIFIATDENDSTFFKPIEQAYDVLYITHFEKLLKDLNPNLLALVEQLVASRSRIFYGTYFSTFSNFIVRLRGYYSVKEKLNGHTAGVLENTYYLQPRVMNEMLVYHAISQPFFARAFPVAWRDIDGID